MWVVAIIFAAVTVILLSGKGGFLIAGYNTASKKEKAQYDEVKLSRVMGSGFAVITILLIIGACFQENAPDFLDWLIPAAIFIIVIVILILTNTICKNKNPQQVEETESEKLRNRKIMKYTWIFIIVLFCAIGVLLVTGDVKVSLNNDQIQINGSYWPDESIRYEDIKSVTYTDNLVVGDRTNGLGSFKLSEGHFKNQQFGKYILYAYTQCKSYVVIDTNNGIYVMNAKTSGDTEKLYQQILGQYRK